MFAKRDVLLASVEGTLKDHLTTYFDGKSDDELNIYAFAASLPADYHLEDTVTTSENTGEVRALLEEWAGQSDCPYLNTETFAQETPVWAMPRNDVIVLENYVFAVSELLGNDKAGHSIFTNPHNHNELFGGEAQAQLRTDPRLAPIFAVEEAEQLAADEAITPDIITKLITMLTKLDEVLAPNAVGVQQPAPEPESDSDSLDAILDSALEEMGGPVPENAIIEAALAEVDAPPAAAASIPVLVPLSDEEKQAKAQQYVADFIGFVETLSPAKQAALYACPIRRYRTGGGYDRMDFGIALNGGGKEMACINTTQIALWQLVKHFRPEVMVPARVRLIAAMQSYQFSEGEQPSVADNTQLALSAFGVTPAQMQQAQGQLQQFIAAFSQNPQVGNPDQANEQFSRIMQMAASLQQQTPADSERLQQVLTHFQRQMPAIVQAQQAGMRAAQAQGLSQAEQIRAAMTAGVAALPAHALGANPGTAAAIKNTFAQIGEVAVAAQQSGANPVAAMLQSLPQVMRGAAAVVQRQIPGRSSTAARAAAPAPASSMPAGSAFADSLRRGLGNQDGGGGGAVAAEPVPVSATESHQHSLSARSVLVTSRGTQTDGGGRVLQARPYGQ
jgi:hypothetical protein